MSKEKQSTRIQAGGYLIEKGGFGWYVLDWDYEGYTDHLFGPYKTKRAAVDKAIAKSYGS